jgi:hypothetical protein
VSVAAAPVVTGPGRTEYRAPLVAGAELHDDVPLREEGKAGEPTPVGPAQQGVAGTVVTPAPGAGVVVEPVTAASLES